MVSGIHPPYPMGRPALLRKDLGSITNLASEKKWAFLGLAKGQRERNIFWSFREREAKITCF